MRDPARIEPMLMAIKEMWLLQPDLRLGQLLVNVVRPTEPCPDIFYLEDEILLQKLAAYKKQIS